MYLIVLVAAVASLAVSEGQNLASEPTALTPQTVYGVLAALIVAVVALGQLFGSNQPVQEGWTFTHMVIAGVWALYLLSGLILVLAGFTGWVVLGNLAIAILAGIIFWLLYNSD